jgi:hypothetical protein
VAAIQKLDALQIRKQELLAESTVNRHVLRLETGSIQLRLERFKLGWWQTGWKFAAPLAGFLVARKFKAADGLFRKGSLALLILRKLWQLWRSRNALNRSQERAGEHVSAASS